MTDLRVTVSIDPESVAFAKSCVWPLARSTYSSPTLVPDAFWKKPSPYV